jgi:hypothetical protein
MTIIAAKEALYFGYDGSGFTGFGKIAIAANFESLFSV